MLDSKTLKILFGDQPWFGGHTFGRQTSKQHNLYLTALISQMVRAGKPLRIIEAGVWLGFTSLTLAYAIDAFSPDGGELICVDPLAPYFDNVDLEKSDQANAMQTMLRTGIALDLFRHNISCGPARIPIRHIKATSGDALPSLEAGAFDLVYLDGSHYYDDVMADIRNAKRLVRDGGIVVGDDLNAVIGEVSEEKVRAHIRENHVRDDRSGISFHPGVTLAVAENFPRISRAEELWAVKKLGDSFEAADFQNGKIMIPGHFTPEMVAEIQHVLATKTALSF